MDNLPFALFKAKNPTRALSRTHVCVMGAQDMSKLELLTSVTLQ